MGKSLTQYLQNFSIRHRYNYLLKCLFQEFLHQPYPKQNNQTTNKNKPSKAQHKEQNNRQE